MKSWFTRFLIPASILTVVVQANGKANDSTELSFERDIRPIFREYCFDCHGATDEIEGGLDLRLVRLLLAGGDSGPAIVAGDAAASHLLQRVEDGDMPPGETRVDAEKIATLRRWVDAGAVTLRAEPESIGPGIPLSEEDRNYWAYRPVVRPPVPNRDQIAQHGDRIRNTVDALLAVEMSEGLEFSPDADRFTLIQRLYDDLLGLPPTRRELDRWMEATESDWYEKLVDTLLDSPHYGERWARHWLDAAGYADSEGFTETDAPRIWAWRYRDYVIRAINEDRPLDQFVREQLAGDELAGPRQGDWTARQIELLTATGFLRLAADGTGSGDNSIEARNKTIADTLQIVGTTLMGTSLQCAQCHDHRYDPISHRDYFAIRAVFDPSLDWQNWKTPGERLVSLKTEAQRQQAEAIEAQVREVTDQKNNRQNELINQALEMELAKFDEPLRSELRIAYQTAVADRSPAQIELLNQHPSVNISPGVLYQYLPQAQDELKTFDTKIEQLRSDIPEEQFVRALVEPAGHNPQTFLFHRGDPNQPLHPIAPGVPAVTADEGAEIELPADDPDLPTTGRRLAFANWLTGPENPLTSRALVNRVWMHHFGRGLVATPGDFGRLGSQPTHPELLDWLASELVDSGWSLKHLHRQILTSTAWRQSSLRDPRGEAIDAENHDYWRQSIRRIDAEVLRDMTLATAGRLDRRPYGPPVPVREDDAGQVNVDEDQPRRSLYVQSRRSQPVAALQTFDAPVMSVNCDARTVSTVATQSLMMINGDFMLSSAAAIAQRSAERAERISAEPTAETIAWVDSLMRDVKPVWSYGTADTSDTRSDRFALLPLEHFADSRWQAGPTLPDANVGWVFLNAQGGHPGGPSRPAVRRWTAPANGSIEIAGVLGAASENGDGVQGRILVAGQAVGSWSSHHDTVATHVDPIVVAAGVSVDFVVDCLAHETSDSFTWPVTITLRTEPDTLQRFDSVAGFSGPPTGLDLLPRQIESAWQLVLQRPPTQEEMDLVLRFAAEQYVSLRQQASSLPDQRTAADQVLINICQMLLTSNEYLYVE
jgi:hypothetical protein